jgi:hypothetical protein
MDKKALVIAVSDYQNQVLRNKEGKELDFCRKDGIEVSKLLKSIGFDEVRKQIGDVKFIDMRDSIYDFFYNRNVRGSDTLLFYYSGHGIPDSSGNDNYLASSEIDPDRPDYRGVSFSELTGKMDNLPSQVVCILDCCYSGAAKLSKGESNSARKGNIIVRKKSELLKQGKCILAASQAAQEAYATQKGDYSVFTYYLIKGLKRNKNSVDKNGNVTAASLATYIHETIMNLPPKERPKQEPIRKEEAGGDIILARYPRLAWKRLTRRSAPIEIYPSDEYGDFMRKRYPKLWQDWGEVANLNRYWENKFLTNTPLPIEKINSFENEYISDRFHLWNASQPSSEPYRIRNSEIIVNELYPKIDKLKRLSYKPGDRYGRKIRLNLQKSVSKTLRKINFPP